MDQDLYQYLMNKYLQQGGRAGPISGQYLQQQVGGNPQVRDYILNKYRDVQGPTPTSSVETTPPMMPQATQPAVSVSPPPIYKDEQPQNDFGYQMAQLGQGLSEAAAGIVSPGDILLRTQRPEPSQFVSQYIQKKKLGREEKESKFQEKVRQEQLAEMSRQDLVRKEMTNRDSQTSQARRAAVLAVFPDIRQLAPNFDNMSAQDLEQAIPVQTLKAIQDTEEAKARVEEYKVSTQLIRETRAKNKRTDAREDIVNKFNSDATVKQAKAVGAQAQLLEDMLNSGDWQAAKNAVVPLARMLGEKGALSDKDRAEVKQRMGIVQNIEDWVYNKIKGELNPDLMKSFKLMTSLAKEYAPNTITQQAQLHAKQKAQAYRELGLEEKEIFEMLDPVGVEKEEMKKTQEGLLSQQYSDNLKLEQEKSRVINETIQKVDTIIKPDMEKPVKLVITLTNKGQTIKPYTEENLKGFLNDIHGRTNYSVYTDKKGKTYLIIDRRQWKPPPRQKRYDEPDFITGLDLGY